MFVASLTRRSVRSAGLIAIRVAAEWRISRLGPGFRKVGISGGGKRRQRGLSGRTGTFGLGTVLRSLLSCEVGSGWFRFLRVCPAW